MKGTALRFQRDAEETSLETSTFCCSDADLGLKGAESHIDRDPRSFSSRIVLGEEDIEHVRCTNLQALASSYIGRWELVVRAQGTSYEYSWRALNARRWLIDF